MWNGGWYGMIFAPLFMIAVVAIVAAALIIRSMGGARHAMAPPHYPPPVRTPIDILKERFARGEINTEEFEERRRVLGE